MKLNEMALALGCSLDGDGDIEISGVAGIDEAQGGHVTFVSNPKYASRARTTSASAVIVENNFPRIPPATLRSGNPYLTFARAVELFYQIPVPSRGISSSAQIAASAKIGANASIGPFVVIEDEVEIGDDCILYPFVQIYRGARIGRSFKAYSHVSVREYCQIGDRVILQDGVKIGTDGYGYAKQSDGSYYKIVQSGVVILEDDVEVGANSTIDRGTIGETRIRRGAKIDNLVQVGHASDVGQNSLLCAQVGLAGSSKIGSNVILTGQVGVSGHLTIGDGVIVTAQSGIPGDVESGKIVSGSPAMDNRLWLRATALIKRLPELLKRIEALEKHLSSHQSADATSHNRDL